MSSARRIFAIARKDLRETARDRRTTMVTLISAIAAGPIFLVLIFNLISGQAERARDLKLPVVGQQHAPALVEFLQRQQVTLSEAPPDYEAQIRRGDIDVVLVVDENFGADVDQGRAGTVRLVFDRSRDRARSSIDQAEELLASYNRLWGAQRLVLRGVHGSVANPLNVEARNLATPQQSGAIVLFLVGYYALFAAIMGGMALALDTSAGERERQSLEPLLMTPARPHEIAVGKWLAVTGMNALVVLMTLAGFWMTLTFAPLPAVGVPFLFGARELSRFLLVLLPITLLMPALLLYVGSRARTFREAQTNVSLIFFVVSIIPVAQMFLQKREPDWIAAVPITGQYSLLNLALRGEALPPLMVALSYVAPLAITALALLGVARLVSRESALSGK